MNKKTTKSQKIWATIFVVLLVMCLGYYAIALEKNVTNTINIIIACLFLAVGFYLSEMSFHQEKWKSGWTHVLPFLVFLGSPLFMVAFIWDYWLKGNNVLNFFQNAILIYILQGVLFALIYRIKIVMYISIFLNWFFFFADEIVLVLRKTPLVPTDLLSIKTAVSVAGNYTFEFTSRLIVATAFSVMLVYIIHKLELKKTMIETSKMLEQLGVRFAFLVCSGILILYVGSFQRGEFKKDNFDVENMNENVGTLLAFYLNSKEMFLEEPSGYTAAKAERLLDEYTDETEEYVEASTVFDDDNPNVIIIMDEAFSDLEVLGDLELDRDPLSFCHELVSNDNVISGELNVSVWGGNTCNTEFEVLTGNTLQLLPYGSIPYMQYVNKNTYSICDYFHRLGYRNVAIHPYWGQCWRRDTIYNQIGFDEFIDAEDFDVESSTRNLDNITIHSGFDFGDLEYVREYISDRESFRKIIEQYENKGADERLFIFNVTMQNHGGYLYDGDNFEYTIKSNRYNAPSVNQYLSLVQKTDEAFEELISYFKQAEEPTVILFFGDHQPGLANEFYEEMFGHTYENFTISDYQKRYTVPYYIWANYDLNSLCDAQTDVTSTNYLSLILKEAAGLPLDSWDNFRKEVQEEYPVLTARMLVDCNGTRYLRDGVQDELLDQYELIQYYQMKEDK